MRSTILVFSIAIAFAVGSPIADQVVPEDADYTLDDDLMEAHAKVQEMMAAGKSLADCRNLEDATKKDIEDAVRDGQKIIDSLPKCEGCESEGQGDVKLATDAKAKADKYVITCSTKVKEAASAKVEFGSRTFSSLTEGKCSSFYTSTAYTTATAKYNAAIKEHQISIGRAAAADTALKSAIAEAAKAKHDCICRIRYEHEETFKRLTKDNTANKKDWTFAHKLECVHSGQTVCKIPACPEVKKKDLGKFMFYKCILQGKQAVEMKFKGNGCCRYPGWGPANGQGYQTEEKCKELCLKDTTCNAVDTARPKNGKYDCFLFTKGTNEHVVKNLKTECGTTNKSEKCFYKKRAA